MVYLRLVVYGFVGLSKGHRVFTKTECKGTCLQAIGMLTLEPERLTPMRPQPEGRSSAMDWAEAATSRRSSGLQFQFFGS